MNSPFPKSASAAGEGRVVVRLLPHDISALESIAYQYPLKLISPTTKAGQKSVLVFFLSYGGGLVGGDQVDLVVEIRPKARLTIVTQGHTKIFKPAAAGTTTRQNLRADIHEGGALCLLPDPVQPFEGSRAEQTQIFKLAANASLCLLDWVTHGRSARGENWDLAKWTGRNEIWTTGQAVGSKNRLLVRDTVILDGSPSSAQPIPLRDSMHGHAIFGTLLLRGPLTKSLGHFFLSEFAALPRIGARDFRSTAEREGAIDQLSALEKWRASRISQEARDEILWSAANIRGCVVVKFGASTVEAGRDWLGSMLAQEGSVVQNFGEEALMCVR